MLKKTDAFLLLPGLPMRRMVRLLLLAILLLSLMTSCQEPPNNNNSKYDPRNITRNDDHLEALPQIAVDLDGLVHLVYHRTDKDHYYGPFDVMYMHQLADGGWSDPIMLSESSDHSSVTPKIVVDSQSTLHVIWEENSQIYYAYKTDNGQWTQPQSISPDQIIQPNLGVDGMDRVIVVGVGVPGWFRENVQMNWLAPERFPVDMLNPAISVAPSGTVNIVFELPVQLIGYIRRSSDGIWSTYDEVSPPDTTRPYNGYPWIPQVTENLDTVYVSWKNESLNKILWRKRNPGGLWGTVDTLQVIEGVPSYAYLSVYDLGICFAWKERRDDFNYEIYYAIRKYSGEWEGPVLVSNTPTSSGGLCILIQYNQLYLAWQELLDESKYGNRDIYFQKIELGG